MLLCCQLEMTTLSDKFVPMCHVDYFINDDKQKLTDEYICRTFYTSRD